MIPILINGEPREVPANLSVESLLAHLGLAGQPLLVEHNGVALFKSDWPEIIVGAGDRLELIRVVAGG